MDIWAGGGEYYEGVAWGGEGGGLGGGGLRSFLVFFEFPNLRLYDALMYYVIVYMCFIVVTECLSYIANMLYTILNEVCTVYIYIYRRN